jgi:ribonuclease P protein component
MSAERARTASAPACRPRAVVAFSRTAAARAVIGSRSRCTRSRALLAPATFARDRRIRKRADFLRVQQTGRRVSAPHFTFLVARTQPVANAPGSETGARAIAARFQAASVSEGPARLGLVVSKKVGNAPARNRVKRLCRECFRTLAGFAPPGIDLVVIARPGAERLCLADVTAEWRRIRGALARAAEAT